LKCIAKTFLSLGVAAAAASHAGAAQQDAEIMVSSDIAVSTTWTANNTYNLQNQIYVLPGATLPWSAACRR